LVDRNHEIPEQLSGLEAVLNILGKSELREGQLQPILAAMRGESVLVVRPTGSGKTMCFQIPAMLTPGTAFVLSPLKALMSQQSQELHSLRIPSTFLNGDLGPDEKRLRYQLLENKELKFFYCTPERFDASMVRPEEVRRVSRTRPAFLVVDEAHCVNRWGRDFRPNYGRIGAIRQDLGQPPVLAFTATAGPIARDQIRQSLGMDVAAKTYVADVDRPNISLARIVAPLTGPQRASRYRQGSDPDDFSPDRVAITAQLLRNLPPGRAMIFVPTVKQGDKLHTDLAALGLDVPFYHGKLKANDRANLLGQYLGQLEPSIHAVICTSAFGMGLDVPDVRLVIHWSQSPSIEDYLQELGRAGRDGRPALAVVFVDPGGRDVDLLTYMAGLTVEGRRDLSAEDAAGIRLERNAEIASLRALIDPRAPRQPRSRRKGRASSNCFRQELLDAMQGTDVPPPPSLALRILDRFFARRLRRAKASFCCDACKPALHQHVEAGDLALVLGH
jgi:ATP-dependent DNA helicase RecQ